MWRLSQAVTPTSFRKKDLGTANGLVASPANPTLFQTVNIDKATISGFEIKGNMAWGRFAEVLN